MARPYRLLTLFCMFSFLSACNTLPKVEEEVNNTLILKKYALAMQAYQKKDWPRATSLFKSITKTDPSNSEAWFKLGNIYARENKAKEAINFYHEAAIRAPTNAKIWHNLGVIQLRQATLSFFRVTKHSNSEDPLSIRAAKIIHLYDQVQDTINFNKFEEQTKLESTINSRVVRE